ncbi:MAG: hypothetical protein AMXMBFR84_40170 [Candidatus Hydrogenedentota bacterium]
MNVFLVDTIFRKELLDMIRDRRTIVAMIFIPIVLYPSLFIFGSQALLMERDQIATTPSTYVIQAENPEAIFALLVEEPLLSMNNSSNPEADLKDGKIDAIVAVEEGFDTQMLLDQTAAIRILYDATEAASAEAARRIERGLESGNGKILARRLENIGLNEEFVQPISIQKTNIASSTKATGALLGTIIPLVMILMLGIGAFYPAIDLTAGEKERGTLETLLSTPVTTLDIVAGKFLAVFCLAMVTGLLNLGSMMLTLSFQLSQLKDSLGDWQIQLPFSNVLLILLVMLPLAFFISAMMMSLAVFARSFREAQTFVTPFFALLIFPAAFAALPGTELSTWTQMVPITNTALLFKSLLTSEATGQQIFIVLMSTTGYALIALLLANAIFRNEELILSEEHGIHFSMRRSEIPPRSYPTLSTAFLLFTICGLLLFYVGTVVQSRYALYGVAMTQWLLFLAPTVLILWYMRVDLKASLHLRMPSPFALLAGVLIAAGWLIIQLQLGFLQQRIFTVPEEFAEAMRDMLDIQGAPLVLLLFATAVSPAICEELLFRGAILSAFRRRFPMWICVIAVGILFGVAHLSVYRVMLTAASGMLLTYLVWRSRSIWVSMLVHLLLNSTAILLERSIASEYAYVPKWLTNAVIHADETGNPLPTWLLMSAIGLFVAGMGVLEATSRHNPVVDKT